MLSESYERHCPLGAASQLRDESGGQCGCTGDLSLDNLVILGGKESFWDPVDFASDDAALCLDATDIVPGSAHPDLGRYSSVARGGFDTNATYDLMYFEQNMPPLARTYVDNNYRNMIYWDGVLLDVSENRPRIPLSLLRNVRWDGGLSVARDGLTHNLTMVLNSPLAGTEVGVACDSRVCTDAFGELQPEATRTNNVFSVPVKFCGNRAEVGPGTFAFVGRQRVPWGGTACLEEDDVHNVTLADGTVVFGVDIAYSEMNTGLKVRDVGLIARRSRAERRAPRT